MRRDRKGLAIVGLLLAAGCTSDSSRRDIRRDDPILGLASRPTNQPVAVATSTPTYNPPPAYTPSPPITATPTSTAALAAGGFQPLPGSSDLRIGSGSPTLGAPASNTVSPNPPSPDPRLALNGGAGVTPAGGVSPAPPPSYTGGGASAPARSGLDAAFASVAAVQPLWHRLTYNGQAREYVFSMSVPNRLNSAAPRTVEATAPTPEQSIRMALDQLQRERE